MLLPFGLDITSQNQIGVYFTEHNNIVLHHGMLPKLCQRYAVIIEHSHAWAIQPRRGASWQYPPGTSHAMHGTAAAGCGAT
jgi:hypothetical protein